MGIWSGREVWRTVENVRFSRAKRTCGIYWRDELWHKIRRDCSGGSGMSFLGGPRRKTSGSWGTKGQQHRLNSDIFIFCKLLMIQSIPAKGKRSGALLRPVWRLLHERRTDWQQVYRRIHFVNNIMLLRMLQPLSTTCTNSWPDVSEGFSVS